MERGRIVVGHLIVENLALVLVLVLLPALTEVLEGKPATASAGSGLLLAMDITTGKIAAFDAFVLIIGRRVTSWIMHYVGYQLMGATQAVGACGRAGHGLRGGGVLWRLVPARRLLRRYNLA